MKLTSFLNKKWLGNLNVQLSKPTLNKVNYDCFQKAVKRLFPAGFSAGSCSKMQFSCLFYPSLTCASLESFLTKAFSPLV